MAGQPTKYRASYVKIAAAMCKLGATDQNLASEFKVDVSTISNWKVKHKPFFEALKTNKPAYDDQVERSLAHRATGYPYEEVKTVSVDGITIEKTITTKHMPSDPRAALAWLYNRRGEKWHPKPEAPEDDTEIAAQKVIIEVVDARKKGG